MAACKPGFQRKNIDLEQSVIDALSKQAIDTGNKNFKRYAELLLTAQANKKTVDALKQFTMSEDEINLSNYNRILKSKS